ncbi:MAG: hypothetical protein LIP77_09205 [Planctomycetes bacterium]|nr:hypothetical protein [Planctomycetota bacterium]
MASKMDIVNLALANLSREPIQSLNEANPEALQLRTHWDTALASILRDHPWGFAMRRKVLTALAESPIGFTYAYTYPGDCIQARRLFPAGGGRAGRVGHPFEIGRSLDGRYKAILTDLPAAALEYTTRQVPCEEFDPQFVNALAWRLTAEISLAVHADPQSHQAALTTYAAQLQQAKAMDMRESSSPRLPDGDFLGARHG